MSFTYRGLKAELERHIITDAEVEHQLERLQQQTPRICVITDRPSQLGDEMVLDYAGFCDGAQFDGGTAQQQTLVLGSGTFIPGFEEQLLNKLPGEEPVVQVRFPEAYHADNLAGKQAEFRCRIHEIRVKTPYQLDDTFAKEVGGCDSMEQMRQLMRRSLQSYSDERGEMDLQDRLLRQAAATLEFEPTQEQIETELDEQMQTLRAQLGQQGLTLEMYCQFMNTTEDALRRDARSNAEQSVRAQKTIEEITRLEKLEASQEEIDQAVAVICRQNNLTAQQLEPYRDAEFEKAVVRGVLSSKVLRLIRDSADVSETR